jgi:hypothetical protein
MSVAVCSWCPVHEAYKSDTVGGYKLVMPIVFLRLRQNFIEFRAENAAGMAR